MLNIRNMKSDRCRSFVQTELMKLGIPYKSVNLGEVKLTEDISPEMFRQMEIALRNAGLELIQDRKTKLVEKIKSAVHQLICNSDDLQKPNTSEFISEKVKYDYSYLSKLFASVNGITIEKYIISEKIEQVKVMLSETDSNLADIAFKQHYSSIAHLSAQFKKITGLTPTVFKELFSRDRQISGKV